MARSQKRLKIKAVIRSDRNYVNNGEQDFRKAVVETNWAMRDFGCGRI